jgi:hypothetical protein
MKIGLDVLKKAMHASKHPGIGSQASLYALARQGMPYLTSPKGLAQPPITIYWNVNSVCNLHCKMCDVGMFNEDSNFYELTASCMRSRWKNFAVLWMKWPASSP